MADATTTVGELRERVRRFVHVRDWERFHTPKDLAIAISIESGELLEPFLWKESVPASSLSVEDRDAAARELADVVIYGLSLANVLGLDLSEIVLQKLATDADKYPADRFHGRAR